MRIALALLVLPLVVCACKDGSVVDLPDAPASPQATAEPAPLTTAPAGAAAGHIDAGPPPQPLRGDQELPVDTVPRETTRETGVSGLPRDVSRDAASLLPGTRELKELTGYTLEAVLRPTDVPSPPKAAEVSLAGVDAARKKTEARLTIDLSPTRARIAIASSGFVLPKGMELRARVDRYGYIVLWPGEATYRVTASGSLRALFGERRFDVAPLSLEAVGQSGAVAPRLSLPTRRAEVATRAAKATFELATMKDSGDGGALLCRALLDLVDADPSTRLCETDQVPVFAELRWTTRGAITFEVLSALRRYDLAPVMLAAPPPDVTFAPSPPKVPPGEVLLTRAELAAFRSAPIDLPPLAMDAQAPRDDALVLVNSTDELRMVTLDGAPVAWIAPGGRASLTGLVRGRYALQWRTFLGDALEPPQLVVAPGTSEVGAVDGGAP